MNQVFHHSAHTMPFAHQAILANTDGLAMLAARYRLNEKTVAKWRGRPTS
jgi:hypothetical protein